MQSAARNVLKHGARFGQHRFFSAEATEAEHLKQVARWRNITYLAVMGCAGLAFYTLTAGHEHHEKPPAYPYLRIRNKEFPWGDCGLLEKDCPSRAA